jgi:hypothetical protein
MFTLYEMLLMVDVMYFIPFHAHIFFFSRKGKDTCVFPSIAINIHFGENV